VLYENLKSFNPDVVIVLGDDQAENFRRENLPLFCFYMGSEVNGYPFHRPVDKVNLWDEPQDIKYDFNC
jgi:hypothetical protein